jgi:hypothetical protein
LQRFVTTRNRQHQAQKAVHRGTVSKKDCRLFTRPLQDHSSEVSGTHPESAERNVGIKFYDKLIFDLVRRVLDYGSSARIPAKTGGPQPKILGVDAVRHQRGDDAAPVSTTKPLDEHLYFDHDSHNSLK